MKFVNYTSIKQAFKDSGLLCPSRETMDKVNDAVCILVGAMAMMQTEHVRKNRKKVIRDLPGEEGNETQRPSGELVPVKLPMDISESRARKEDIPVESQPVESQPVEPEKPQLVASQIECDPMEKTHQNCKWSLAAQQDTYCRNDKSEHYRTMVNKVPACDLYCPKKQP